MEIQPHEITEAGNIRCSNKWAMGMSHPLVGCAPIEKVKVRRNCELEGNRMIVRMRMVSAVREWSNLVSRLF